MRNLSSYTAAALCTAVAGLVLTGCGSESGTGGTPTTTTPPPTLPTVTQSTPVGTGLPLTVSRTGGFAGFDLVLLRPDLHVVWRGNRLSEDPGRIAAVATGWTAADRGN